MKYDLDSFWLGFVVAVVLCCATFGVRIHYFVSDCQSTGDTCKIIAVKE